MEPKVSEIYYDDLTEKYIHASRLNTTFDFLFIQEVPAIISTDLDYYDNKIAEYTSERSYISLWEIIEKRIISGSTLSEIKNYVVSRYKPVTEDMIMMVYFKLYGKKENSTFFEKTIYNPIEAESELSNLKIQLEKIHYIAQQSTKTVQSIITYPALKTSLITITEQRIILSFKSAQTINYLFDNLQITDRVPLIVLNGKTFKIHPQLKEKNIDQFLTEKINPPYVYLLINISNELSSLVINFKEKKLYFNTKEIELNRETIRRKLTELLPVLTNIQLEEKSEYRGNFQLYGFKYNPVLLSYATMNVPPYNKFFYIDEKHATLATSKREIYHFNSLSNAFDTTSYEKIYKNESIARFSMIASEHSTSSSYNTFIGNKIKLRSNPPYQKFINITFSKAKNIKTVYLLREFLTRIFNHYQQLTEEKIAAFYRENGLNFKVEKIEPTRVVEKKIKDIIETFGLTGDYSRRCPIERRPTKITETEYNILIQDPKNQRRVTSITKTQKGVVIGEKGAKAEKGVKVEEEGERSYYFCKENSHPILEIGEHGPCCYDPRRIRQKKVITKEPEREKEKVKKEYLYATTAVLNPGTIGELSHKLKDYLNKIQPGNYVRLGCEGATVDSFLSCLKNALGLKETEGEIKNKIRKYLEKIDYSFQENLDYTPEEILSRLDDGVNSKIFYNILENLYKISIFIFKMNDSVYFEKYSNNLYYSRTVKPNKSVIMIKRKIKNEGDRYELIIQLIDKIQNSIFDQKITQNLYDLYNYQNNRKLVTYSKKYGLTSNNNFFNLHNYYVFLKDISREDKAQLLDEFGNVRSFRLKKNKNVYVFLCVYPIQANPLEFKTVLNEEDFFVSVPFISEVVDFFEFEPSSVTFSETNEIIGLWYYHQGIHESFYCPIQNITKENAKKYINEEIMFQIKLPLYLFEIRESPIRNQNLIRTTAKKIFTLVSWLFAVSGFKTSIQFEPYLRVEISDIKFSEDIYNLEKLEGSLPNPDTIKPSLDNLNLNLKLNHELAPDLIKKEKNNYYISCYSEKMKTGLLYFLDNFIRNKTQKIDIYYKYESNAKYREKKGLIFNSLKSLKFWFQNKTKYEVQTDLRRLRETEIEYPIIYRDEEKYYLIQKVKNDDFFRCIGVCYQWFTQKINPGYNAKPMEKEIPQNRYFELEIDGKISRNLKELEKIEQEKNRIFMKVLLYSGKKFAAILPL